jgi:hypothetical protein
MAPSVQTRCWMMVVASLLGLRTVGPPSFLFLLKQHVFHREWRTLSPTLPHHVPYLPVSFKHWSFAIALSSLGFRLVFVSPFHFYAISRMLIGRAHCKKKKGNWARIEWIFDFPLNLELESWSCLVQNLSLQSIPSATVDCHSDEMLTFFFFSPKCQTKWMKCGSRWKTFRLFVYGLCFFLFRFVECGRPCIGSLCYIGYVT